MQLHVFGLAATVLLLLPAACSSLLAGGAAPQVLPRAPQSRLAAAVSASAASGTRQGALHVRLLGVGSSAPETRLTNTQMESIVDTSDEWITKRTGIQNRHLLLPNEQLSDLAASAAQRALEMAGVDAEEVGLVVLATSSPDDLFGDAAGVADAVGADNAVAFDLTAACSGFLFGLATAGQFVHNGVYDTALVIGADALSRWVDWGDRNTCVLFGDGAGAVVLRGCGGSGAGDEAGLLGYAMHSNGAGRRNLNAQYIGAEVPLGSLTNVARGTYKPLAMNGKEVYKFATSCVPEVVAEALENAGVTADQVDWLLLHQANFRIVETVATKLGIPLERTLTNLDEYGNTSAGSIPLALDAAVRAGKVKAGDVIAMSGFGAGLSWGSAIIRWG